MLLHLTINVTGIATVGHVLPLEKAGEAQELVKSGKTKGKVVLKIV